MADFRSGDRFAAVAPSTGYFFKIPNYTSTHRERCRFFGVLVLALLCVFEGYVGRRDRIVKEYNSHWMLWQDRLNRAKG